MNTAQIAKAGIIGLTAFILYKIISKGSALHGLQMEIKKIAYTVAPSGFIITVFLTVRNSANETILFNTLDGKLFFNSSEIGSVNNNMQITVPASGEVTLPVSVNLFYMPVVNTIIDLISGKAKGIAEFIFDGTAEVEKIKYPVHLKYSLV